MTRFIVNHLYPSPHKPQHMIIFRTLLMAMVFTLTQSQVQARQEIPNGDFESWPPGNFGNPEFWDSPNEDTSGFPFFLTTVSQTSDSHTGDYAAQLTTGSVLGQVIPGVLTLGELIVNIENPEASEFIGIPFSERPSGLSGFYKYSTTGSDFGVVALLLTRFNEQTQNKDTIAFGLRELTPESEYTDFNFEVNYLSYEEPDSMNVVIISSASPDMTDGSELIIDDLLLAYEDPPVVDLGDDVYICPGQSHTFDLGFIEDHTYSWIDLTSGEVVSEDPEFTVFDPGEYMAVVQNPNGLPGMDTVEVFLHDDVPEVFELAADGIFCLESPAIEFILGGSEQDMLYTLWKNDAAVSDPVSGTGNELVFGPYEDEGMYFVQIENPSGPCDSTTDTLDVQLVPTPQVFEVTGGGSYDGESDGVEVGLSGSETGVNYLLIRDGETTVTEKAGTGDSLSFGLFGEGVYTAEAVNSLAYCSEMMTGEAVVSISTSIEVAEKMEFKVYPNPARSYIYISSDSNIDKVAIYDLTGELVYTKHFRAESVRLDLAALAEGIYLARISAGKNVHIERFSVIR